MLYRPKDHTLWDTTVFHDGDHVHLFYIAGKGQLGHAVSKDWAHWQERPLIELYGHEKSWNQSGVICNTVLEVDGTYRLMAGGGNPEGEWVMGLFSSGDLENWEPHPDNPVLRADGTIYTRGPNAIHCMHPAWRDPHIEQWDDGWYHCLMCARRPHWDHTTTGGVIAHLRSRDLVDWEPLEPLADTGDRFLFAEVPGHFEINGRHYLIFLDMGWGGTRNHTPSRDDAAGTFYMWSELRDGPYHWPDDPLLLGADDQRLESWAAKVLVHDSEHILYSHVASNQGGASLATPKIIKEKSPGVLELLYAGTIEATENKKLTIYGNSVEHRPHDLGVWTQDNDKLTGRADACASSTVIAREQIDFHLQTVVTLEQGAAAGVILRATDKDEKFLINGDPPTAIEVLLDYERQLIELRGVGHVPMHGWGSIFMEAIDQKRSRLARQRVRTVLERNRPYRLRCIVRAEFFEVYLDDIWMITIALQDAPEHGDVELLVERGQALFENTRLATLEPLD